MNSDSENEVRDDVSHRAALRSGERQRRSSNAGVMGAGVSSPHAADQGSSSINGDSRPGIRVVLEEWLERNKHDCTCKCMQVRDNEQFISSHIVVTDDSLYILHDTDVPGEAILQSHRPLNSIMKITTKKKVPDVIKIQYGASSAGNVRITDLDRLHVPKKSAKVIASIKKMMMLHQGGSTAARAAE